MPLFDGIDTPVQLGADLQLASSNGWPYFVSSQNAMVPWDQLIVVSEWDHAGLNETRRFGVSESLVDMCIHRGELYVVWVEARWDAATSNRLRHGPFVKRWDGSSWTLVGGAVDPDVVASPVGERPLYPVGTKFGQSRPRIVSDGVNLYVGYCCHVVAVAPGRPAAANDPDDDVYLYINKKNVQWTYENPAFTSWESFAEENHAVAADELLLWDARWAFVRRWTGGEWEPYGEIEPKSYNTCNTRTFWHEAFGGTQRSTFSPTLMLSASPADVGAVYMGFIEEGPNSAAEQWISSALLFGLDWYSNHVFGVVRRCVAGRFDGSGVSGTIKELSYHDFVFGGYRARDDFRYWEWTDMVWEMEVDSRTGEPLLFLHRFGQDIVSISGGGYTYYTDPKVEVRRWGDLSVVLTHSMGPDPTTTGQDPFNSIQQFGLASIGHSEERGRYYWTGYKVKQIPADASSDFLPLDFDVYGAATGLGSATWTARPIEESPLYYTKPELVLDEPNNIWGIGDANSVLSFQRPGPRVVLYHRPCLGWFVYGYVTPSVAGETVVGVPAIQRIGNNLYVAAAVTDTSGDEQHLTGALGDLRIAVYKIPILRNVYSCSPSPGGGGQGVRLSTDPHVVPMGNEDVSVQ